MQVVVTSRAIRHAKLWAKRHHQQTNTQFFYMLNALPVAQPTVSEHWRDDFAGWNVMLKIQLGILYCYILQQKKLFKMYIIHFSFVNQYLFRNDEYPAFNLRSQCSSHMFHFNTVNANNNNFYKQILKYQI